MKKTKLFEFVNFHKLFLKKYFPNNLERIKYYLYPQRTNSAFNMKNYIYLFIFTLFGIFSIKAQEIIISQTSGDYTEEGIACEEDDGLSTLDNYYFRKYDLSNHDLDEDEISLIGLEFGSSLLITPPSYPATFYIAVYDETNFPNAYDIENLPTPIASGEVTSTIYDSEETDMIHGYFDEPVTVSSDSELVVMYSFNGSETPTLFYPAAQSEETAPSYIATFNCEINIPQSFASINFPESHIIMNIIASNELMSVHNEKLSDIVIYPNPVKDIIYLDLPTDLLIEEIKLHNILGEAINIEINNEQIDVSQLSSGVYFLRLTSNAGEFKQKIIIE